MESGTHKFFLNEEIAVDATVIAVDTRLDARGLNCPLPILRTKKALAQLKSGEVLKIFATDPGSVADFSAFCRQTGNKLLESGQEDGAFFFRIQKA